MLIHWDVIGYLLECLQDMSRPKNEGYDESEMQGLPFSSKLIFSVIDAVKDRENTRPIEKLSWSIGEDTNDVVH